MRMNWTAVGLARNDSVSQNRPTVTSITSSGVSLQVARCTNMGDAIHRALDAVAIGNRAFDDLEPGRFGEHAIVTERPDRQVRRPRLGPKSADQIGADLSGRARDQKLHQTFLGGGYKLSADDRRIDAGLAPRNGLLTLITRPTARPIAAMWMRFTCMPKRFGASRPLKNDAAATRSRRMIQKTFGMLLVAAARRLSRKVSICVRSAERSPRTGSLGSMPRWSPRTRPQRSSRFFWASGESLFGKAASRGHSSPATLRA